MKKKSNSANRFIIPKIKVDAPISFKKAGKEGKMPMPDSPDDVVYYDFSLLPGFGGLIGKSGNAIFSGHVDSGFDYCDYGKTPPPCKAVLWDLDQLVPSDILAIIYNGKEYKYKVSSNKKMGIRRLQKVLMSTKGEMITIITCSGNFDFDNHSYEKRQVVRAKRVTISKRDAIYPFRNNT